MMDAARKALKEAKAKEEALAARLEEKYSEEIGQVKEAADKAKAKTGAGIDSAKEKVGDGVEQTREKTGQIKDSVSSTLESTTRTIGGVKESVSASVSSTVTKVKKGLTPPKTVKESGIISDSIYLVCNGCEARIGPIKESKLKAMMSKLSTSLKTGVGTVTGSPTMLVGGAVLSKDALLTRVGPGSGDGARGEIKEKAKHLMGQCDKCAKWNCANCFDSQSGLCKNCG